MINRANKTLRNKSQSISAADSQMQSGGGSTFEFVDNRPEAVEQSKLQEMGNNSAQAKQFKAFHNIAKNSPQAKKNSSIADYDK